MKQTFQPVPLTGLSDLEQLKVLRMNSLGSLYHFIKVTLRRKRLTDHLHLPVCRFLESEHLKDLYEMPRDHFKSTMCTEGLPMWWALPFTDEDEKMFRLHGYGDEFIRWMRKVHDPQVRILLVSENITNSAKLGYRIRRHFESNAVYRTLFPETLPTGSCIWANFSLHVNRGPNAAPHGEGTFDFLGVGGALQSRHYKKVVQDDLVGRKAVESSSIMEKTIEYHQLLVGAFDADDDSHENDELVVGNRWGFHDLNSHIREHEPWFRVTSHGALGGCCVHHPSDTPIFPEDFSYEKLMQLKKRLGTYRFSCQFLNNPAAPDNADFRAEWINYFYIKEDAVSGDKTIQFEVRDGVIKKDIPLGRLSITMVVDPAHANNAGEGRCRHAIMVVGQDGEGNFFLLENWAQAGSYDLFFSKIYEIAEKWKIRRIGFESVAAQKFGIYHINYLNRTKMWPIRVVELKGEVEDPDGGVTRKKEWRIKNVLAPIFEFGRFFCLKSQQGVIQQQSFIEEFTTFPKGRYCDQLDALAYAPQMLRTPKSDKNRMEHLMANQRGARKVNQRYSVAVH